MMKTELRQQAQNIDAQRTTDGIVVGDLVDLLKPAEFTGDSSVRIRGVSADSRRVVPGDLFTALPGQKSDGHEYIKEALERGASALLVKLPVTGLGESAANIPILRVDDVLEAMGHSAAFIHGYPARSMNFIGFTGTNGKTTSAFLTEHLLKAKGIPVGLVTTVEDRWPGHSRQASYTTPRADEYQKMLAEMRDAGVWCVVSEVSSHALKQHRMIGIRADAAVFSNLTMEHRELHPTWEDYYQTKKRLFTEVLKPKGSACINVDDPAGRRMIAELKSEGRKVVVYGLTDDAEVTARNIRMSFEGTSFELVVPRGSVKVKSPLVGAYNVSNQLAAVSSTLILDLDLEFVAEALGTFPGTPGRLERIDEGQDFLALVDYAHTPDALEKVLQTVRPIVKGKLITLMGCGGSRSSEKREPMGRIAVENSDFVVVTADNSRWERTEDIIKQIEKGMVGHEDRYIVEPDRALAILEAVRRAGSSDCVILCGKGHENTQTEQGKARHFDDRIECRKALRAMAAERSKRD